MRTIVTLVSSITITIILSAFRSSNMLKGLASLIPNASKTSRSSVDAAMSHTTSGQPVHIVLVGDSIFDNEVYVGRSGKSVIKHLNDKIPTEWKASLIAIDGDVVEGVIRRQIGRIPKDATHIFLSIGGNDALGAQGVTSKSVGSVAEALIALSAVRKRFKNSYDEMLKQLLKLKLPTTICTIYNPSYGDSPQQTVASMGLTALNDAIIEAALRNHLPVIDLKTMFSSPKDYANPIEPSTQGGDKITDAIMRIMNNYDFNSQKTEIFA
ncbi:hypothetical protein RvY_15500 [Ramazzottius varieornatus]|uniref:SGNH hydrolase-type esterase domain-containing protein n=1 Tax=Ramazzottius varieornatus TaxID=947166 RepID=A0A1D1VV57_RAMVA|nr:hypothetical protein RvY_15500 [Ramazzottius varieornatus]